MGRTAPEEEDYFTISWKKLIIMSGVVVLIGAIVITIGYRIGSQGRMLEAHGIETNATITGKSVEQRRSTSGTSNRNDYFVRYQFKVGSETHVDRKGVSRSFYESVRFGDAVSLRYLPSDPTVNEIEPGQYMTNSWIAMGIGGLIVLAGGAILLMPRKVKKPSPAITGAS